MLHPMVRDEEKNCKFVPFNVPLASWGVLEDLITWSAARGGPAPGSWSSVPPAAANIPLNPPRQRGHDHVFRFTRSIKPKNEILRHDSASWKYQHIKIAIGIGEFLQHRPLGLEHEEDAYQRKLVALSVES